MRKPLLLAILLFVFLAVLPLLAGLGQALFKSFGLLSVFSEGATVKHWALLLGDKAFWFSLGFSFYVAATGTCLALVLALTFTIGLRHNFQKGWYQNLLYLPLSLPALVMAFFSYQLLSSGGLLSRLSYHMGWISEPNQFPSLVNDDYGIGIIFTHLLMSTFFFTVYFLQIWQKENLQSLMAAARNLGAGFWSAIRRIAIPTLVHQSRSIIILYFVFALGSYEIPLLLGRTYPQMLSVFTVSKLQKFNLQDIPQAYAVAVFYAFIMLLVLIGLRRKTSSQ